MGKLVSNWFMSLDGVVEAPDQWHFDYFSDEMGAVIGAGMTTAGAFLMGREMYDQWSQYWPSDEGEDFGPFINAIDKYVVSSTLVDPTWENTTVVAGDHDEIRRLKAATEGDLMMSGSIRTVRWLLAEGLIDELHLLIHPVIVGSGEKLFVDGPKIPLRLVSSAAITSGVLHLVYAST